MYLLFSVTGEQEEGNQGLESTHLAIPLLQQDRYSGTDARIVDSSYLHCVPVVVPGGNVVHYLEQQWGLLLKIGHHVLPFEADQVINWNGAKE